MSWSCEGQSTLFNSDTVPANRGHSLTPTSQPDTPASAAASRLGSQTDSVSSLEVKPVSLRTGSLLPPSVLPKDTQVITTECV